MDEGSGEEQELYHRKQHAIVEDWDREKKERMKHGSRREETQNICV